MKQNSDDRVQRVTYTSRKVFSLTIFLFCLAGAIAALFQLLELTWKWLEMVGIILFGISQLLLVVSFIVPGVLIVLGTPRLAHAWFRGGNKTIWKTPWENLSGFSKYCFYFGALLSFIFALLIILVWVLQAIRG